MSKSDSRSAAQIVYLSHGGGPLPILGDRGHAAMVEFMRQLPLRLRKPDAILVISAHWEERSATLLGSEAPPLFYDYYGFPEEAYQIQYPAPGHPDLANRIAGLLEKNDVSAEITTDRGFDHGLFIPLKLMYPKAEVPSLQLSLLSGLSSEAHLNLGKALHELAAENILVVGSGFSFHNLRAFASHRAAVPDERNDAFQEWLIEVCTAADRRGQRERELINWEQAPFARYCHPREEHLLPLHVCAGMASREAQVVFDDYIFGKRSVAFLW